MPVAGKTALIPFGITAGRYAMFFRQGGHINDSIVKKFSEKRRF